MLSYYRRHENNVTNKILELRDYETKVHSANYRRMEALLSSGEAMEYRARIATLWGELAYQYSIAYRLGEARSAYRQAMSIHPAMRRRYRFGLMKTFLPAKVLRFLRTLRHGGTIP